MLTFLLFVSVLLALLLLLLAVPVDLAFQIEGNQGFKGQISVRWLFGVIRFRIPVPDATAQRPRTVTTQQATKKGAIKKRATRKKRGARPNLAAVLRRAEFRQRAYRFAKDLIHAVHIRNLRLLMRLGLGDPADTGRLWALAGPLSAIAGNLRSADVRIEPEFMDAVLEVQADGQLRMIPLQLFGLVVGFVLSPPSIRAWHTLSRSHA